MANFILPCDPNDVTHLDADNRRRETRDWLRQQQRKLLRLGIVNGEKIPEPRGTARDGER
jgi:hypothetical protein